MIHHSCVEEVRGHGREGREVRDGVENRGVGRREAWRALLHVLKEGKCLRLC